MEGATASIGQPCVCCAACTANQSNTSKTGAYLLQAGMAGMNPREPYPGVSDLMMRYSNMHTTCAVRASSPASLRGASTAQHHRFVDLSSCF